MLGFFIPTHLAIILSKLYPCSKEINESMETVCKPLNCTPLVLSTFGGLGREATIF